MRRAVLTFVASLVLTVTPLAFAASASADPANSNTLHITLDCGTAGRLPAVFELSSSDSFHVVSFGSNFLWKTLAYVTPTGQSGVIDRGSDDLDTGGVGIVELHELLGLDRA